MCEYSYPYEYGAMATGPVSKVRNWEEFITFGISYFTFGVSYFRSFLLSRQDPYEYEYSTSTSFLLSYSYSGSASDREFAIGIGIRQVAASGRLRHRMLVRYLVS